jgi:DNA-binding NtrC family response regulator
MSGQQVMLCAIVCTIEPASRSQCDNRVVAYDVKSDRIQAAARILVVDDEDSVRRMLATWLRLWAHDVIDVNSAEAALRAMEANPAEILLINLIMPVRSGRWLIERVRERWPLAAIIAQSGTLEDTVIASAMQAGAIAFLPKPFTREMLHQVLEQALSRITPVHSVAS